MRSVHGFSDHDLTFFDITDALIFPAMYGAQTGKYVADILRLLFTAFGIKRFLSLCDDVFQFLLIQIRINIRSA